MAIAVPNKLPWGVKVSRGAMTSAVAPLLLALLAEKTLSELQRPLSSWSLSKGRVMLLEAPLARRVARPSGVPSGFKGIRYTLAGDACKVGGT